MVGKQVVIEVEHEAPYTKEIPGNRTIGVNFVPVEIF
jgi:hypothetical protein